MSTEKPVHIPRNQYPEPMYPEVIAPFSGEAETEEVHLLDYWRVIIARRWAILAILLTAVTTTVIYTLKQTPIYQATASIQIDKENQNILTFKDVYQIETSTDDTLRTQFEILKSRTLARRVIEDLKLDKSEEFKPQEPGFFGLATNYVRDILVPKSVQGTKEPDQLRPIIDAYLGRLDVSPVNVSFESKDPELAARVINSHARHFIEQNLRFKVDATEEASVFLRENLATLRATLEKSEDQLQEYSRQNQILFTDEGKNTATEKLRQLEEAYTKAQGDRIQKESYDGLLRDGTTDALPQVIDNRLITDLTAKLADLQREESELQVTFRPDYPLRQRVAGQITQIRSSIQMEKERVITMIRSEYSASLERERLLGIELEKQRDLVNKINEDVIQYNILKKEAESNRQLYDGLLTRLKEAGVSAGLTASNIRVVDLAEVPPFPVRPRKTLSVVLSMVMGLVFGVGFAFFQEYLDNTIKAPEDISRHLNLPTLGMIPRLESLSGKKGYGAKYGYGYGHSQDYLPKSDALSGKLERVTNVDRIVHDAPGSLMAEAYRSIRTSLLLSSPGHPPQTIVVTSANPSEGKTVTAVNIAISLTQTGSKVVLIDVDMRKPRVAGIFSLTDKPGLSAFLAGTAALKDIIYETDIPGLLVIPCGVTPPNPGELVLSAGFRRMIDVLREYFDYVVMDSPPVGNVSDARILAASMDSTILVVKAFSTSRQHAQHAIAHLRDARARLGGVVLNDVDVRRRSYYSGYSYYRTYYSSYANYGQKGSQSS
jgi:succinoglycan biosynthesis transport protein ExoP